MKASLERAGSSYEGIDGAGDAQEEEEGGNGKGEEDLVEDFWDEQEVGDGECHFGLDWT